MPRAHHGIDGLLQQISDKSRSGGNQGMLTGDDDNDIQSNRVRLNEKESDHVGRPQGIETGPFGILNRGGGL